MKFVLNSLTDVAEALRGEYEERAGKFYLKTEGDYPLLVESNTKLAEFRDNNRTLNTKVTDLTDNLKKFEGIDPTEHATLKTRLADLEKTGAKDKDSVGELIKAAVKAAVDPLLLENKTRKESEEAARAAVARTGLENQLREAGNKAGIDDRAMPDYINRGLQVFKLVDGKAAPRNGDAPIFSKTSPANELSMDEWAAALQTDAPFLFKTSKGGGAGGNGSAGGFTGVRKTISSDPIEFGRNLESIAKGETIVAQ